MSSDECLTGSQAVEGRNSKRWKCFNDTFRGHSANMTSKLARMTLWWLAYAVECDDTTLVLALETRL